IAGLDLPIAGGNYFRQFPGWFMRRAVARWHRKVEAPFVMYFHVWELDPDQPKINAASWLTRIRHYRNLGRMEEILQHYFRTYSFISIAEYLGLDTSTHASPKDARLSEVSTLVLCRDSGIMPTLPATVAPDHKKPVSIVVPCYNE